MIRIPKVSLLVPSLLLLTASAPSQQVALSEDFSSGVPPAGWTTINNNGSSSQGWIASLDLRAWHEDEPLAHGGLTCDDFLVSPALDLSTFATAHLQFANELQYADYLANHPASQGDGRNDVEITTDGGATWTLAWTETRVADGVETTHVNLSSWVGMSNVQIGFRYYGTWAQEWWIDDVLVDDQGSGPVLSLSGLVAGQTATVQVERCTPGGRVLTAYSLAGGGPVRTSWGVGLLTPPYTVLPAMTADAGGVASSTAAVPSRATGMTVWVQALDEGSLALSNGLGLTIG